MKDFAETIVDDFGIGDGDLSHQCKRLRCAQTLQRAIDHGIDAAYKERRHRGDLGWIGAAFQSLDIGASDGLVVPHGKHQRDVDVDAIGDERLDGGNPFGSRRNFNHYVGAVHCRLEAFCFGDRPLGVMR